MDRFYAFLLAIFVLSAGLVAGSRLMRLKNPRAVYTVQKKVLYLDEPVKLQQLAAILTDSLDVVENQEELMWAAGMLGWYSFKPGRYVIKGGATYNQFLSKVARGLQDPITVTILPGRMKETILSTLAENFRFDSTAIHRVAVDTSFLKSYGVTPKTLVGYLYPETYRFYWTASPKEVLSVIFSKFYEAIQPYKKRLTELDKTLNEILTLASIVEWEAAQDSVKPIISGLYWNRLQQGMLLQADATVIYAIGEKRRLFLEDYETKSPYNTYLHPGLPPGPITNPDLSSIKAALFPAEHHYLYMVAQPGGGHAFSKTYAQHLKKAEIWREWIEKQYKIKRRRQKDDSQ